MVYKVLSVESVNRIAIDLSTGAQPILVVQPNEISRAAYRGSSPHSIKKSMQTIEKSPVPSCSSSRGFFWCNFVAHEKRCPPAR